MMGRKPQGGKPRRRAGLASRAGIRVRVLIGFGVFTAVIVALLWVFQIALLNTFYRAIKMNEIRSVAERVESLLDSGAAVSEYFAITRDTNVSILICDGTGANVNLSVDAQGDVLNRFDRLSCMRLFLEVKQAGGTVMTENNEAFSAPNTGGRGAPADDPSNIIFAHTVTLKEGTEYLILLSARVIPVDSTVETLKVQLWCLTAVMILLALVLAFTIAGRLSKPVEQINETAKQLAAGRYDVRFPENGAKELSELASTLNFAASELGKVEDLRRELIANVSHDLRTPLTMISGYAEVMRDLPGENTPENTQVIIDESNRLSQLVTDLLDLSRLESGAQQLAPEVFNLTEEIQNILHRYDKLADFQFPFLFDGEVFVSADRLKLSQVVYNLVNNAINYSGKDKTVTLWQTVENGSVRISVTDTGEGIPAEQLPHIWQRYYRVDKEHRRAQVGTGLGLFIVQKILDLHGGRYGVTSAPGKGSTFWFELPVLSSEQ